MADKRKSLRCRVRVLMAEQRERLAVKNVSGLQRALKGIGVEISIAQLGRLIDNKTNHWNGEVIEGLMTLFDCGIGDLFESESGNAGKT